MDLPRVRRGMGTPRPAPDAAYAAALASAGPRERLMMRLAAEAGLRRGEISRVHVDDLMQDFDGWSILVHGKGGRDRLIPVPESLAVGLVEHAGRGGGYVFPGAHDGHLSPQRVGDLVSELLPDGWTAHTLRHRFASRAFRVDRDLNHGSESPGSLVGGDDTALRGGVPAGHAPDRRHAGGVVKGGAYRERLLEAVEWDRRCREAVREAGPAAPARRRRAASAASSGSGSMAPAVVVVVIVREGWCSFSLA